MAQVMIKILQGSVITQTVLDGLTIYSSVASYSLCQKLWKSVGSGQSYLQQ